MKLDQETAEISGRETDIFSGCAGSAKTVQAGKQRWAAITADHVIGNSVQTDDQKFFAFFIFINPILLHGIII